MKNLDRFINAERFMVFARHSETSHLYALSYRNHAKDSLYMWPVDFDPFELTVRAGMTKQSASKFITDCMKFKLFWQTSGLNPESLFVRQIKLGLRIDEPIETKVRKMRETKPGDIRIIGSTCHYKTSTISFVGATSDGEALIKQIGIFVRKHCKVDMIMHKLCGMKSVGGRLESTVQVTFNPEVKIAVVRRLVQDRYSDLTAHASRKPLNDYL